MSPIKFKNPYSVAYFFFLLSAILFVIFNVYIQGTNQEEVLHYSREEFEVVYDVYLVENPFFAEETLPMGQIYVTDLIDNFSFHFTYDFSHSHATMMRYTYEIVAVMYALYTVGGGTERILEKTFPLLELQVGSSTTPSFLIDEMFNISLEQFNNYINEFEQVLGISLTSGLHLQLIVEAEMYHNGVPITHEFISDVVITLGGRTTQVIGDLSFIDEQIYTGRLPSTLSPLKILIPVLTLLYFVAGGIYWIKAYHNNKKRQPYNFSVQLTKLIKASKGRTVQLKSDTYLRRMDGIEVTNFEELIKLCDDFLSPILFFKGEAEANFYVMGNTMLFVYKLNYLQELANETEV